MTPALPRPARPLALVLALAACGPVPDAETPGTDAPTLADGIEIGPDGACYGRDTAPAVVETVTAQEQVTAPVLGPDGRIARPATYRTVTRQQILRDREEVVFETLCPPAYTAPFVESLQRALAARGYFRGAVTGHWDAATGRAVQDFQRQDGPDSPLLSLGAARRLGLVALSQDQLDRLSES
ncbi:peptidoglycan-binding domain-containing protein [Wenxinia saemankumensis]|uniref:Putative peptidoglycan binding domain-containing protein n=1 Tax=Wenxinia saemankumensis TaxID=1447782 RepID=A0A1M6ES94_9RHOB|nr:peptidoglycan-binding domain-containing protein [Wenxinia saemankumensis]SHI88347.1 Putative peptidoglycan binding domain-containing protein [Wenxinia saemankumensis]